MKESCRIPSDLVMMPTIEAVVFELKQMCGWMHLGMHFGFTRKTLVALQSESVELSKIHLVATWLGKEKETTWRDLVMALCGIHRKHLAVKIATKYGKSHVVLSHGMPFHNVVR